METQEKLLAALRAKFPGDTETALAARCGLSIARFSNYKLGKRAMDVDAVIGCAQALGWDVRATVAQHEIETSPSPRVKALWKKLAATATSLIFAIGICGSAGKAYAVSVSALPSSIATSSSAGKLYTLCEITGGAGLGVAGTEIAAPQAQLCTDRSLLLTASFCTQHPR